MKNYLFHVGIDISKLKLDVVVIGSETPNLSDHFVVENTSKGVKEIVDYLIKKKIDPDKTLFCCENTGVYTAPLSIYLNGKKYDYWVVPAIEIKRSKGISRGKNDKADAKDIALYSIRSIDKLKLSTVAEIEIQQLKLLHNEREKIVKTILLFNSFLENEGHLPNVVCKVVLNINQKMIKNSKLALKAIELKMKEILNNHIELKKKFDLAKSVPGIGDQTAMYLLITTKGFTSFENARKFACYSGVAPFEYSSGTSVRGKTKVNHMADKKMKSLLQMCALTSVKYDPQMKAYYLKKRAEGKNAMLVLNNVKNKIIARVFCVVNRKTPFANTYNFAS
ncbi:MAG: transposase [Flavobacterium sp.]|nr:transposase [Flavobacterium sp.]